MFRYPVILIAIVLSGIVSADEASQTDWTGGPFLQAPSEVWSDTFNSSQNSNYVYSGILSLAFNIMETPVYYSVWEGYNSDPGDCDGDGDIDLFYTYHDTIFTAINADGAGTSWFPGDTLAYCETGYWNNFKSTDIDGDNDIDLITSQVANGPYILNWFENTSQGWQEHFVDSTAEDIYSYIDCADFDGDADQDIVINTSSYQNPSISWLENLDGTGGSWNKHSVSYEDYPVFLYPADLDNDGDIDIAGFFKYSVIAYENADGTGSEWVEHSVQSGLNRCLDGSCGDVDNDGDIDIFILDANSSEFSIILCRNEGDYSWQKIHIKTWDPGPNYVVLLCKLQAVDAELDGSTDIFTSYSVLDMSMDAFGELFFIENSNDLGTEWSSTVLVDSTPYYMPSELNGADISGEGAPDLVVSPGIDDLIVWWRFSDGYVSPGNLYSNILEIPVPFDDTIEWGAITFDSSVPAGTGLEFYLRGSSDPENLGEWSGPIVTSGTSLQGILDETDYFVQYRADMNSESGESSPVLESIQLNWNLLGLAEEPDVTTDTYCLLITENPAYGSLSVGFQIPKTGTVRIDLFDISGRLVNTLTNGEFNKGFHQVQISDLSAGIYFCRMFTDDFTATRKLIVF